MLIETCKLYMVGVIKELEGKIEKRMDWKGAEESAGCMARGFMCVVTW